MKIEIILGRIFLVILSTVIMFVMVDYASIWFLPQGKSKIQTELDVEAETAFVRKPKPYVMFGGTPNATYEYHYKGERLNSMGYRGKAPALQKAPGEFRIFLLGGSTVLFGGPTLAMLLEEKFKADGFAHVNVYNFGVISSVSGMELTRILFEISDMQPDLIVMYGGGNDITLPPYYDPRPGYPFNFMVYDGNPLTSSDVRSYPALTMLAYGSNLLRHFFPSYFMDKLVPLRQFRKEAKWGTKEWGESLVSCYVSNLIKADKISQTFGARFVSFYQPLVYFKKNLTPAEKEWTDTESANYLYMRDLTRASVASYNKQSRQNLEFIDLSDIFAETREQVFRDRIHLLQKHFDTVANALYRNTSKYVSVKK